MGCYRDDFALEKFLNNDQSFRVSGSELESTLKDASFQNEVSLSEFIYQSEINCGNDEMDILTKNLSYFSLILLLLHKVSY